MMFQTEEDERIYFLLIRIRFITCLKTFIRTQMCLYLQQILVGKDRLINMPLSVS